MFEGARHICISAANNLALDLIYMVTYGCIKTLELQGFVAIVVALAEMVHCVNYKHVGFTSIA
jgi:hypothetical protein